MNRGMDKEVVVYIHTQWNITQPLRKNKMMPFAATWMDLDVILRSKSDTERQISYDITYMWNLKKKGTNELIYKTEVESRM